MGHADHGWTQEQAGEWQTTVVTFAGLLARLGVEADIDAYHLHERGIDWIRYGPNAVEDSDLVFVAVSKAWNRRFDGREHPTSGAGSAREADALLGLYANNRDLFREKLALVFLPGADTDEVPRTLEGIQRFTVRELSVAGLDDINRFMADQPRFSRPESSRAESQGTRERSAEAIMDELRHIRAMLEPLTDSPSAGATVRGIDEAMAAGGARSQGRSSAATGSTADAHSRSLVVREHARFPVHLVAERLRSAERVRVMSTWMGNLNELIGPLCDAVARGIDARILLQNPRLAAAARRGRELGLNKKGGHSAPGYIEAELSQFAQRASLAGVAGRLQVCLFDAHPGVYWFAVDTMHLVAVFVRGKWVIETPFLQIESSTKDAAASSMFLEHIDAQFESLWGDPTTSAVRFRRRGYEISET